MATYRTPKMLIGGEWTNGSGRPIPVLNPATEEVLAELPTATQADLDRALASTQRGFELWRSMSAEKRCEIIHAGARLLRERSDHVAEMMTLEEGKPVAEAKIEVVRAAGILEWDANEGRRAYGTIIQSDPGFLRYGLRLPIGPVAAFTPWNAPTANPTKKVAAALGAGCSLIIKPSEETPYSLFAVIEALVDGGLPPEVINLVYGNAAEISSYVIASPVTRVVSFTGPTSVGKHLAQLASAHMKPVVMELGGHSPVIVMDDVDPAAVAKLGVMSKIRNAGQICIAPTRFLVQEKIHDAFVESYVAATKAIKVGNGLEKGVQMGPLANPRRLAAMEGFVADAVARGATLETGGKRIGNQGYFFEPTVLSDIPDDANVLNVEPFGPISAMIRFSDLDEAVQIANKLPYGLASYAFTNSAAATEKLVKRVESGIMSINHFGATAADTPFGGVKESGYGREGGYESLDAFMITKFTSQKMAV